MAGENMCNATAQMVTGGPAEPEIDIVMHLCVRCNHPREDHYHNLGNCKHTNGLSECSCSRYRGR